MATTPEEAPQPPVLDVLRDERPDLIPVLEDRIKASREDPSRADEMTRDEFLAKFLPDS